MLVQGAVHSRDESSGDCSCEGPRDSDGRWTWRGSWRRRAAPRPSASSARLCRPASGRAPDSARGDRATQWVGLASAPERGGRFAARSGAGSGPERATLEGLVAAWSSRGARRRSRAGRHRSPVDRRHRSLARHRRVRILPSQRSSTALALSARALSISMRGRSLRPHLTRWRSSQVWPSGYRSRAGRRHPSRGDRRPPNREGHRLVRAASVDQSHRKRRWLRRYCSPRRSLALPAPALLLARSLARCVYSLTAAHARLVW
jgi:hypothetical protein